MVPEISPKDAHQRLSAAPDQVTLLDVRQDVELKLCRIAGATHIPMNDIPARLGELDKQREIIVHCHKGGRSYRVAAFLIEQGFTNVKNLSGGIDGWAVDVDPKLARY